jgi:hypothetical protein
MLRIKTHIFSGVNSCNLDWCAVYTATYTLTVWSFRGI